MAKIRAKHYQTGEIREFSELIFKNIPSISLMGGEVYRNGGWIQIPGEENTPEAALIAEKKAAEKAAEDAAKQTQLKQAAAKDLIASVEAKIKKGVSDFNFNTELKPYLEAKGWTAELGTKSTSEVVKELKIRVV